MVLNYIIPAARGIELGNVLTVSKQNEDTIRQGRNQKMAVLLQIPQVYYTLKQVDSALEATNHSGLHWSAKAACLLTPFVVAYGASRSFSNKKIRKIINFAHDHIGTLAHIVTAVSVVILFTAGQTIFASVSLVYLGIGVLDRKQILPQKCRRIFKDSGFVIGNITAIIFGDYFSKGFAILDIAFTITNKWIEFKNKRNPIKTVSHPKTPPVQLTLQQLTSMTDYTPIKMNRHHVHFDSMPPVPDQVTLDSLEDLCKNFPWEKKAEPNKKSHLDVLKTKLKLNERWNEVAKESGKEISYLKEEFSTFITSVKNEKIAYGEPIDYKDLKYYLRFIAYKLPEQDEQTQADILISLAVEGGGDYCGPAKFRIAEECFSTLIGTAKGIPPKMRIYHILQKERERQFQKIYKCIWSIPSNKLLDKLVDSHDIHTYNQWVNILADEMGLPKQGAKEDSTAVIPPLTQFAFSKLLKPFRALFWTGGFWGTVPPITIEGYTEDIILEKVKEKVGTTQIPTTHFFNWLNDWILNQASLSAEQREQMSEDLNSGDGHINGDPILYTGLNGKPKVRDKYIKALLVDMNVVSV